MQKRTIGFIGAGNMAGAIIKGLSELKMQNIDAISAYDPRRECLDDLAREYGVKPAASNLEICRDNEVIIIAVKPQKINEVFKDISHVVDENKVLISIAAGVTMFKIESHLKKKARLVRVMPNTPMLIGKGMSAVTWGNSVLEEDKKFVLDLFSSVGKVVEVGEHMMDAVTALSGSGPAYVFSFIEGLADGGVKVGLGRKEALLMAAQTVAGAAEMLLATGKHPGELRDIVTSPGGTTIQGCHVLDEAGFKGHLISAVEAGYLRARQLGEE